MFYFFFRMSFFVEAVDQPIKLDEKKSAIAVVELQVHNYIAFFKDRLRYTDR